MSLLSHSPSSVKGLGEQEKCLKTGGKPTSLQSSKRARRRTQGIQDGQLILDLISKQV